MKKFLCVLLICTGVFCACGKKEEAKPVETITPIEQEAEEKTEQEKEEQKEEEPVRTMDAEKGDVPYTIRLDAGLPLYAAPSYDNASCGVIEQSTVYSIVEEKKDAEGHTWGKLKSGAGWVDLDAMLEGSDAVTISEADAALLKSGNYHEFIADNVEGMQKIAIRAKEEVSAFALMDMELTDKGMQFGNTLYTQERLTPDKPLVIGVVFWGDLTTYGVSFMNAGGQPEFYTLSISGRNGDVVCTPYTP